MYDLSYTILIFDGFGKNVYDKSCLITLSTPSAHSTSVRFPIPLSTSIYIPPFTLYYLSSFLYPLASCDYSILFFFLPNSLSIPIPLQSSPFLPLLTLSSPFLKSSGFSISPFPLAPHPYTKTPPPFYPHTKSGLCRVPMYS